MKTIFKFATKSVKIILIAFGILVALIIGIIAVFLLVANYKNTHYWKYATPGGNIEAHYTALGPYDVSCVEFDAGNETYQKFEIWYPSEMKDSGAAYPLVIMANGTGVKASQYKAVFQHLASWGFIVAGNEDENSRTGASSSATLDYLLALNADQNSEFYGRIDMDNIGIGGHSQGGVGAINAVTAQDNGRLYKAIYTASTTSPYWGQENVFGLEWSYDISAINIPCFMVAGTGFADAGTAEDITATEGQGICPLWALSESYAAIPAAVPKVMAREVDKDHGDMLCSSDGYMTAWFMYWLKGDEAAGTAFFGENAELLSNSNWQDASVGGQP